MNKKIPASLLLLSLLSGPVTTFASEQTTTQLPVEHTKAKATLDENTYAKEVDQWMKENKPNSASTADLLAFVAKLKFKIIIDGQKYGDENLIARQYTAYILYDIAFVGDSVFSGLIDNTPQVIKNMPAPANGTYPNTVTKTADIPDNETQQTISSTSYYIDNGSDKTVIMHGGFRNSWTNGNDNSQTRLFYDRGYNILIVDNRATGLSGGSYITFGSYESDDILYWINQEITTKPNQKILLDGGSMGASTVLSTLSKAIPTNVKGVVADCGFASIYDQLSDAYDTLVNAASQNDIAKGLIESLGLTAEFKQENLDRVNRIYAKNWVNLDLNADLPLAGVQKSTIPKLFIHGTADSVVPYTNMARLYANSSGYKQSFTVEGADHGQSLAVDPKGYNANLDKFLDVVFNDKVAVHYLDENGKQLPGVAIKTITGSYGDPYDVSSKAYHLDIDHYVFKEIKGQATGTFTDKLQEIDYIYSRAPEKAKDVTINYVDETGTKIHDNQVISGNISDTYDTTTPTYQLTINGYTLDKTKIPENAKGTLSSTAQTVTYTYKKNKY